MYRLFIGRNLWFKILIALQMEDQIHLLKQVPGLTTSRSLAGTSWIIGITYPNL